MINEHDIADMRPEPPPPATNLKLNLLALAALVVACFWFGV